MNTARLNFVELIVPPERKTRVWEIRNQADDTLGRVTFRPQWRAYVFEVPTGGTIGLEWFDASCLQEIVDFVKLETYKWRGGR